MGDSEEYEWYQVGLNGKNIPIRNHLINEELSCEQISSWVPLRLLRRNISSNKSNNDLTKK